MGTTRSTRRQFYSDLPGFALLDQLVEIDEEWVGIVGAGCCFGMILHRKNRELFVAEAFDSVVVEIDLGDHRASFFEAVWIRREAVVLRGDGNSAGFEIFDWLVAAAMTELEFEGRAAERVTEHLMSETDPEGRIIWDQIHDRLVHIIESGGIAGPIREKEAVRIVFAD